MTRILLIILVALLLSGCYCRKCWGWSNDLVVDATEAKEYKQTFADLLNMDPDGLINLIFLIATNKNLPKSSTETVAINTAQLNRWFNTNDNGSFMSQAYWNLGRSAARTRVPARPVVINECIKQAPQRLPDAAKRQRFLDRINPSLIAEEY